MFSIRTINLFGTFLLFLYGVVLYYFGLKIENQNNWMIDRGFWPEWLGLLLVLITIITFFQTLKQKNYKIKLKLSLNTSFIVVLTLTAFYLLNFFGYALTTIFWMFGVGYFAGEKSVKKLLVFSIVVVFIGYIIFWKILSVQLPLGSFEKYLGLDFFLYG